MVINNQALFYALIQGQIKTQQCQKLSCLEVECSQAVVRMDSLKSSRLWHASQMVKISSKNQSKPSQLYSQIPPSHKIEKAKTYHEHLEEFKEKPGGGNNDHHPLTLEESSTLLHMKVLLDCLAMLNHFGILLVLLNRTVSLHPIHKALVGISRARNEMVSVVRM